MEVAPDHTSDWGNPETIGTFLIPVADTEV